MKFLIKKTELYKEFRIFFSFSSKNINKISFFVWKYGYLFLKNNCTCKYRHFNVTTLVPEIDNIPTENRWHCIRRGSV